jgi:hypothetical protein
LCDSGNGASIAQPLFVPSEPTADALLKIWISAMSLADSQTRARKAARGPQILAALLAGTSVDEIARTEVLSPKRVEKALLVELRRRWTPPPQEYARLQIARLEVASARLAAKVAAGDTSAIDSLVRVADRLDRYHGFSKFMPTIPVYDERARERLLAKLDRAAARLLPALRTEP